MLISFLRLSNLVPHSCTGFSLLKHLAKGDIIFKPRKVLVLVKWSETMQNNNQVTLISVHRIAGSPLCPVCAISNLLVGPRWQSGNTLASHLCGRGSIPVMAVSGKAGSCLPLVGSLQYRTLANYMYWFPLPFQLPVVI